MTTDLLPTSIEADPPATPGHPFTPRSAAGARLACRISTEDRDLFDAARGTDAAVRVVDLVTGEVLAVRWAECSPESEWSACRCDAEVI